MSYSQEDLMTVFGKAAACCYRCGRLLRFANYGVKDAIGAWQVERSDPRGKGDSDDSINWWPICTQCLEKREHAEGD